MGGSSSKVGNSSSLPTQSVGAENAGESSSREQNVVGGGPSKAALAIWKKLSARLADNPSATWTQALNNAEELAQSVVGQDLDPKLQADLLGNFNLLEQTLLGLKIKPSDDHPYPHDFVKSSLLVMKLNIVTDSDDLRKLDNLIAHSSNQSELTIRSKSS